MSYKYRAFLLYVGLQFCTDTHTERERRTDRLQCENHMRRNDKQFILDELKVKRVAIIQEDICWKVMLESKTGGYKLCIISIKVLV